MRKNKPVYILMLILTAVIWGSAFVAQSVGGELLGPLSFNGIRNIIGGCVLLPLIPLLGRLSGNNRPAAPAKEAKILWIGGIRCGVLLGVASSLQQWGIGYATVGKAGFITAMYIIIVPVLGIFVKRSPGARVWTAVGISLLGLYLLCWSGSGFGLGDLLLFGCSVLFSFHILVIDRFSPLVDGVKLSCIQFFTAGILCGVPALVIERPTWAAVCAAALPILYAGVLSSGVAYTLQVVAQRHVDPTVASLVLSLESVFGVLAGWLLLNESLSARELTGCALMFLAIILAQLPAKKDNNERTGKSVCL